MGHVTSSPGPTTSGGRPGELRSLPVPDGLEGQRVDQALSRLFGVSRAAAAELADAGGVRGRRPGPRQGRPAHRRQLAGGRAARRHRASRSRRRRSTGMPILHDDDDVVVVDKPVGVAAHPSPGWDGPTVIGGLAAAGYRISTSRRGRAAGHRPPAGRRHDRA